MYLINGYNIKEFETKDQALDHIKKDVEQYNLNVQLVYHKVEKNLEIYIYQYHTLYMETYVLLNELNIRK